MRDAMGRHRKLVAESETEVEMLRRALAPFAAYGHKLRTVNRSGSARMVIYDHGSAVLTMGDFDRAAELLHGYTEPQRIAAPSAQPQTDGGDRDPR